MVLRASHPKVCGFARGILTTRRRRAVCRRSGSVFKAIREPSIEEAVALLFARDYNLQSLAVLHWRHARIELLSRIALLAGGQTSPIGHDDALAALQDQYRIGSLLIDFFPEILWTASLSNGAAAESDYVSAVAQLKDDVDRNNHLSLALYRQFMTRQPIDALFSATAVPPRRR
jgi:hypothetical protein